MGYLQKNWGKCLLLIVLVLIFATSSFGWYATVNTNSNSYHSFGLIRVDVAICNDENTPLRILPIMPDPNDLTNVEPNRTIIGSGTLTLLNPPPDANAPAARRFALPLTGELTVATPGVRVVSNCYVFIGLPRPDNNDIDANNAEQIPDFIDDTLPNLRPGDYLLSCSIANINGQRAIAQKVIRITDGKGGPAERCLKICSENQDMLKKIDKQNETIDKTTKQTLQNTNMITLIVNRILQIVSKK